MEDQDQMPSSSSSATTNINNGGKAKTVRFTKLFSFADKTDVLLMVLGTIGSVANGFATPLRAVVLGKTIDSFGTMNQSDQTELVHAISKVSVDYVYLAIGAGVASFLGSKEFSDDHIVISGLTNTYSQYVDDDFGSRFKWSRPAKLSDESYATIEWMIKAAADIKKPPAL